MSFELLIICLVGLLVFGPKKMPMLARDLAKLWQFCSHLKQEFSKFWDEKLKELTLEDNENKAKKADEIYQQGQIREE